MKRQSELEMLFRDHSIDFSTPEFYNHPAFIAAEQSNPEFLWEYADYVQSRSYPEDYLSKARKSLPKIIQFLFDQLLGTDVSVHASMFH